MMPESREFWETSLKYIDMDTIRRMLTSVLGLSSYPAHQGYEQWNESIWTLAILYGAMWQ